MKKVAFITLILVTCEWGCNNPHELRKATSFIVKDNVNYEIYIYQEEEVESSTFLYYSIKNVKSGEFIVDKSFLVSTGDYITGSEDFSAGMLDSVIYITYLDPKRVRAIYDVRTGDKSTAIENASVEEKKLNDSLFTKLILFDQKLVKDL